jgi:hypothetical protein
MVFITDKCYYLVGVHSCVCVHRSDRQTDIGLQVRTASARPQPDTYSNHRKPGPDEHAREASRPRHKAGT